MNQQPVEAATTRTLVGQQQIQPEPISDLGYAKNVNKTWIRGVNIGGWLLAERFITPYLFAVNTCHLNGDLCWYPGQIGIPTNETNICQPEKCQPVTPIPVTEGNADFHPRNPKSYMEYPIDEYTLSETFLNHSSSMGSSTKIGRQYMERHWDTFVTYDDLVQLQQSGVTHLRIPLSYWIRGDIVTGEPWITGGWPYFIRLLHWCRDIGGLQVWADLHGAPGSENGFDNSGQYNQKGTSTCKGWSENMTHVDRTLLILADISRGIADEELQDIVTGFGILNEPFFDCDELVLRNYYNAALDTVRSILGTQTSVFVGDMFRAWKFNDGFWTDPTKHYNTYLDSHPYHVFFEKGRAMTPKQHIAYVCRHNYREVTSCCHDDYLTDNIVPSSGISRIVGEWSGAFDILPTAMAPYIMRVIATTGIAPFLNRTLSSERRSFLRNFVEAQMVTYEAKESGMSGGWLWWNFKMEGGAFAEWDFLRGIEEGWIPSIPHPTISSESLYGSCYEIVNRTTEDYASVVEEYPDPRTLDWNKWQGWDFDDDFVLNDGQGMRPHHRIRHHPYHHRHIYQYWLGSILLGLAGVFVLTRRYKQYKSKGYEQLK